MEGLFWIGGVSESKKQYLKSLVYYEVSLKLHLSVLGEDEDTAVIVYIIGDLCRMRGQHDLALQNFTLVLNVYKYLVGETHLSMANVEEQQKTQNLPACQTQAHSPTSVAKLAP